MTSLPASPPPRRRTSASLTSSSCIVDAIAGTISPASTAARASSRELARDPITASSESTRRIESSGHDEPGAHPQQTILPPERTGRGEGIESAGTAGRLEPEVGAAVAPRDDRRHLVPRHGDLRADRPRLLPCVPSGSTAATAAPALRATCTALSPRPPAPAIRTRSALRSARRTRSARHGVATASVATAAAAKLSRRTGRRCRRAARRTPRGRRRGSAPPARRRDRARGRRRDTTGSGRTARTGNSPACAEQCVIASDDVAGDLVTRDEGKSEPGRTPSTTFRSRCLALVRCRRSSSSPRVVSFGRRSW